MPHLSFAKRGFTGKFDLFVDCHGYTFQAQDWLSVGASAGMSSLYRRGSQLQDRILPLKEMVQARRLEKDVSPVGKEIPPSC